MSTDKKYDIAVTSAPEFIADQSDPENDHYVFAYTMTIRNTGSVPAQLVSRLSREMTLEPGDVISCGTSVGVLPMRPGHVIEVTIEGIGTLRNEYVAAPVGDAAS